METLLGSSRLLEIWRYYQAAIVNTAFGYGCFAALLFLGMNIFLAQLLAHLIGTAFNYFTYSRHVFRGSSPAKLRFVISYAANYFVGLGALTLVTMFIASSYVAGIVAMIIGSAINYVALKIMVFREPAA